MIWVLDDSFVVAVHLELSGCRTLHIEILPVHVCRRGDRDIVFQAAGSLREPVPLHRDLADVCEHHVRIAIERRPLVRHNSGHRLCRGGVDAEDGEGLQDILAGRRRVWHRQVRELGLAFIGVALVTQEGADV